MAVNGRSMASNGCQWLVSEIRTEKLSLIVSDHYITISDVCIFCQSEKIELT